MTNKKKKPITGYEVIDEDGILEFTMKINEGLRTGWQPYGEMIVITCKETGKDRFYQAMVADDGQNLRREKISS